MNNPKLLPALLALLSGDYMGAGLGAASALSGGDSADTGSGTPWSASQATANKYPGAVQAAPMAKSNPITDPGAGSGGYDPMEPPVPGENPYGDQFPEPGDNDYDSLFPDDQSMVDTYGWGTMGGGGGGGGGGGVGLNWLDKIGIGSQIGGTVADALRPPRPPALPGGGGLAKIDPVSLQFMIRRARGY